MYSKEDVFEGKKVTRKERMEVQARIEVEHMLDKSGFKKYKWAGR
jgi:hypothetical protein